MVDHCFSCLQIAVDISPRPSLSDSLQVIITHHLHLLLRFYIHCYVAGNWIRSPSLDQALACPCPGTHSLCSRTFGKEPKKQLGGRREAQVRQDR